MHLTEALDLRNFWGMSVRGIFLPNPDPQKQSISRIRGSAGSAVVFTARILEAITHVHMGVFTVMPTAQLLLFKRTG